MLYTEKSIKRKEVSFSEGLVLIIHYLTKDKLCEGVNLCAIQEDVNMKIKMENV